jgi:hypothetical protein
MLDRGRFPSASAYLTNLPKGLESFPECRVRVLVFEHIGRQYPELVRDVEPGPLASLLAGTLDSSGWVPEVVGQVANLMVRDACLPSDDAYCDWTYEMSLISFGKPLLRQLMRLMSPALLVLGSAKRWSALHTGSELGTSAVRTNGDRNEVVGRLRFPPGIFSELFLIGLCPAFRAALSLARGRDIRVELGQRTDVNAEYVVSWAS